MTFNMKYMIYGLLPDFMKPIAKNGYNKLTGGDSVKEIRSQFIDNQFSSRSEYDRYVDEFESGDIQDIWDEAMNKYRELTGDEEIGSIGFGVAKGYYSITRKMKPSDVVETGVCNGMSTLSILMALRQNDRGYLHSIDYPFRADESLEDFRKDTFQGYGGSAIPSDKNPGWVIPEELKDRWNLIEGKSQRELPKLISELEEIDIFLHDSEHSHPCMMFEYELAYEWLRDGGILLSDDISCNNAFDVFVEVRDPEWGKIANNVGYIIKNQS